VTLRKRDAISHSTWNKVAQCYADKFMPLGLYNETYDAFIAAIASKDNPKLLEVGCGPGNGTKYLFEQLPNLDITGIDIAENMLALARKSNPSATFLKVDGRDIGDFPTTFDGIFCGFFIPYISSEELPKFLSDAYHLLEPKGILYLSFVAGDQDQSGYITNANGDQMYFNYHKKNTVLNVLDQQGYALLLNKELSYTNDSNPPSLHTILLVQKRNTTI
jgi:ubiquinone/menaquinone biosynthesis C-methylase UbiE